MGGLLDSYRFNKEDDFLSTFSHIQSRDVEESLSFYVEEYPTLLRVSFRHFDDIFGGMLQQVEKYFKFFSNEKEDADLLEIFAIFIIACKGAVNWKVKMLFCLFDFDNSENIDKNELSLILSAFTKALSKLCNGLPPTTAKLYLIASVIFKEVDKDNSSTLELEEIIDWSEKNQEFQELMAHFSHIQSFELATMRFNQSLAHVDNLNIPDSITDEFKRQVSLTTLGTLTEAELNLFYDACVESGVINKEIFHLYSQSILAFIISDFTQVKGLDKHEIRKMISLVHHEEKPVVIVEDFMRRTGIPRTGRLSFKKMMELLPSESLLKKVL